MSFRLDKQRAVEAAGVLLRCAPNNRMSRLRLLKLLYFAERESIRDKGRPITGDRVFALDHGPVLSEIYDCIKGTHADPGPWPQHIESEHKDVVLRNDPGVGNLTRYEVGKLKEVWTQYEDMSDWKIVNEVAHKLPEWIDNKPPKGSRRLLPMFAVIKGVGRADDAESILSDGCEAAKLDRFWARVTQSA